jgi:zinc protease
MNGVTISLLAALLALGPHGTSEENTRMNQSNASIPDGVRLLATYHHKAARIDKFQLDNGLRIIIWEDHQAPVAAYHTWFAVGSGDEQVGLTGIAHLFEHLMFKETTNLKAGEMDRLLEANGVNTNAATWLDWTYYMEHLPADKLELVMRLEADRMANMILNQEQLDTEREVVKNERLLRVDNDPDGKLYEDLYDKHFGSHPYGHPTIGWMADIEAISLADCLDFYRVYYSPSNATVVVVGDVQTAQVLALARTYYAGIPAQAIPPRRQPTPMAPREEQQLVLPLPVSAPRILAVYDAPAINNKDAMAIKVLGEMLFNSENASVRKRLVEDEQVATDLGGWSSPFRLAGTLELQINLVPGADWQAVLAMVDEEIERFLAGPCPERAMQAGKNRREMSFLRGSMSVGARARGLGHFETTGGDFAAFFDQPQELSQVDCPAVMRVAQDILAGRRRTVAVAVPQEEGP